MKEMEHIIKKMVPIILANLKMGILMVKALYTIKMVK